MIFVSSWDDGHPLDRRVADMYLERGLSTTFYVPLSNCEGRPVMVHEDLRAIDSCGFEIGNHTANHRYLDTLSAMQVQQQIVEGKKGLEQILGHKVAGFCFPGGRRPAISVARLEMFGISYARTVENLRTDMNFNTFQIPTTLQFYPHSWKVLLRNALYAPNHLARKFELIACRARKGRSLAALANMIDSMANDDIVFHIWGHSWEVEKLEAWHDLGLLLDAVKSSAIKTLTVEQLSQLKVSK